MAKVVLITGAGSGIGREVALLLAKMEYKVVVTDCNEEKVRELANEINSKGGHAISCLLDVQITSHFKEVLAFTKEHYGGLDVWINNAGIMPTGHFLDMSESQIQEVFNINFLGVVRGLQTALPYFKDQSHGQVINIASITAKVPLPYASIYSASKSAIVTLCDGLRVEYSGQGININCVLPGTVRTSLIRNIKPPLFPPLLHPEQVAKAIVALIKRPKANVYLPWYLGPMSLLQLVLPQYLLEVMGKAFKITDSAKPSWIIVTQKIDIQDNLKE